MPKLEAGQTVLSGLSGFARGLVEGMKYRKELELKQTQMEEQKAYREEQTELSRERFELSEKRFESEEAYKEKTFQAKFGPGGTERAGKVQKDIMSLFGRERQITDSSLRAELNLNKLSTDLTKNLSSARMTLDEKDQPKFDADIVQLRKLASEGDEEGANLQIANIVKKYNVSADTGMDIVAKQKGMDNYRKTIEDNDKRLQQLEQMKSSYVKELEAKTNNFVQKTNLPDPVKEEIKQGTLEVRTPEDARKLIPNLMKIEDPQLRNEGAEIILQMMQENQNMPLPSNPESQRENIEEQQKRIWEQELQKTKESMNSPMEGASKIAGGVMDAMTMGVPKSSGAPKRKTTIIGKERLARR